MPTRWRLLTTLAVAAVAASAQYARAGPPFLTDDPQPVELHHFEFYLASQWDLERDAQVGTLPHIEVNYGVIPEVQLHAIIPTVLAHTPGHTAYGLGDIELGFKWRFVRGGDHVPQVGIFPLVTVPTGSAARGLGAGKVTAFVPLWLQKSFDPWLTYGGGGVRITPDGTDVELGWLLQRQLDDAVALGAEIYLTLPTGDSAVRAQINVGAVVGFTEHQQLLISAGPSFGAGSLAQAYFAYYVTL